ncbi:hypothetical protein [Dactylosporangium sp. CA-233914]|uniref:hypothetical protein n=1 Tax=Dactylosporangium sp. CA-233914 TaxID=3239934 RepID=UPI003D908884
MRLVAVRLNIGRARDLIDADPAPAKALMVEAKASAGSALTGVAVRLAVRRDRAGAADGHVVLGAHVVVRPVSADEGYMSAPSSSFARKARWAARLKPAPPSWPL